MTQNTEPTQPLKIEYLEQTPWARERSYSPAVKTTGGTTIWLSGQTCDKDLEGNDISGNFAAQTRTIFKMLDATLRKAGGSLANMVTMTVFIKDVRYGNDFVSIRREFFEDTKFPCSALLTITSFARLGSVIEIQGIAVI
ncbi:MAG: endoribonuclease [Betaproteobacteria bacterium]|nr:endoribonuclease [Betaproteobacteria bacterium]